MVDTRTSFEPPLHRGANDEPTRIHPAAHGVLLVMLVIMAMTFVLAIHSAVPGATSLTSENTAPVRHVGDLPLLGGGGHGAVAMRGEEESDTDKPQDKASPEAGHPAKKPLESIYTGYLKDPASLQFEPDSNLFDEVYRQIKTQHIDNDPDDKLYGGVAKEINELLDEAKLSDEPLKAMTLDKSLPQEIVREYGDKINPNLLWYAMIRGLLEGTDDPYSVLMTPKENSMLMEQMQNKSFGGIGIYIELDHNNKNQLTVLEPLEGTPAFKAGLQAGDQIIKIDGKPTDGITLDLATAAIRGKIGTAVTLTVRRASVMKDYTIERGAIEVASVSHKMLGDGDVGYIQIRQFGAKTGSELGTALDAVQKAGAKALILDLRNNGGGYITAAVETCSHFIAPGALVVYDTHKNGDRSDYNGEAQPRVTLPMVLLVNQYSASASEITAGCFKDYGVATIIGVKTYGKGSVQELYPLPDDAALKLTIAHFFTPKGNKINKIGVEPDIKVEMEAQRVGDKNKDTQLKAALDFLKSKGVI